MYPEKKTSKPNATRLCQQWQQNIRCVCIYIYYIKKRSDRCMRSLAVLVFVCFFRSYFLYVVVEIPNEKDQLLEWTAADLWNRPFVWPMDPAWPSFWVVCLFELQLLDERNSPRSPALYWWLIERVPWEFCASPFQSCVFYSKQFVLDPLLTGEEPRRAISCTFWCGSQGPKALSTLSSRCRCPARPLSVFKLCDSTWHHIDSLILVGNRFGHIYIYIYYCNILYSKL